MIEVKGPDGSINRFPDGTPDEVIERAMGDIFGRPEAAPAAAPPPVQPDTSFGQGVKIGNQAVGRGLAGVAGAPVDLTTGLLNAGMGAANIAAEGVEGAAGLAGYDVDLPTPFEHRIEKPVMGKDWITENFGTLFDLFGGDRVAPEEMSDRQRVLGSAEEFATEALAGGGALKTSKTAADVIPSLVKPYETAPVKTHIGDTVAGAGSGAAVDAVDQGYGPDWMPEWMQKFLAVTLGGASAHTAQDIVTGGVNTARQLDRFIPASRDLIDPNTGRRPSVRSADDAARFAQQAAKGKEGTPDVQAERLERAQREMREADQFFSEADPSTVPTTGTLTTNPGLQLLERGLRDMNEQPFLERDVAVKEAAKRDVNAINPEGDATRPRQVADAEVKSRKSAADQATLEASHDLQDTIEQIQRDVLAAEEAEKMLGESYAPYRGGRDQASEALDKVIVGDTLKPMQRQKNELYDAIDPEGSVMLSTDDLVSLATELEAAAKGLPPSLRDTPDALISDIKATEPKFNPETGENIGGSGEMSFKDMNRMRPKLSDKVTQAREAGQVGMADQYKKFKGAISDKTEDLAEQGTPAGERAKEANRFYQEDFAPFTRGEGGKLRQDVNADDLHRSKTPPTATAGRFLKEGPGGKEAARDMQEILTRAPDPQAGQDAAYNYVLDSLASTVLRGDGTVSETALQKWINNRKGMLSQIPEIASEVDDLLQQVRSRSDATRFARESGIEKKGRAMLRLEEARRNKTLTDEELSKSALSMFAGKNPDKAVATMLSSDDPVSAVKEMRAAFGGDKAADEGLRTAVAEYLIDRLTDAQDLPTHQKLASAFKKWEPVMTEVFGEDMKYLRQAQKRMEALSRKSPSANKGSSTVPRSGVRGAVEKAMKPVEIVTRMLFGALEGGAKMRKYRLMAEQLPDSSGAAQDLIMRMSFDPRVAKHLLARPVKEIGTPTWNAQLIRYMGWTEAGRESGEASAEPLRLGESDSDQKFQSDPEQSIPDEFWENFGPMDLSREEPSKNVEWRVRSQRPTTHLKSNQGGRTVVTKSKRI